MDYLEEDKWIDQSKVSVIGHSRLGKTSLWAAATKDLWLFPTTLDARAALSKESR